MTSSNELESFASSLEERLKERSDDLEEVHLDAAIDAQLTLDDDNVIFDDYANPNAVRNCLSPYVPSTAARIDAVCRQFLGEQQEQEQETWLDIGCGDGRVCLAAAKFQGCQRAYGLDVSPPCIDMANQLVQEEGLQEKVRFFQVDATMDTVELWKQDPSLSQALSTATVVFLYTYPTLLYKLIPLLDRLTNDFCVRSVITLTYHLPAENGNVVEHNQKHDYCVYRSIRCAAAGAHPAAVDK